MLLLIGWGGDARDSYRHAVYVVWAGMCSELLSSGETRRGIEEMPSSRKGTRRGQHIVYS